MRRVIIEWTDARTEEGWTEQDDIEPRLAHVTTIGFLVKETDEMLIVAGSVDAKTQQVFSLTFIPLQCVESRSVLADVMDEPKEDPEEALRRKHEQPKEADKQVQPEEPAPSNSSLHGNCGICQSYLPHADTEGEGYCPKFGRRLSGGWCSGFLPLPETPPPTEVVPKFTREELQTIRTLALVQAQTEPDGGIRRSLRDLEDAADEVDAYLERLEP